MKAVGRSQPRQMLPVDVQRVPAWIGLLYPDVVVARHQGFAAGQAIEKGQATRKIVSRADIAGEQQQIRRVGLQMVEEQTGRPITARPNAPVKIRS
jgi:hypothetical protein